MDNAEMLVALKLAANVQDASQDALLQLLLDRTVDKVLEHTKQAYLPQRAQSLVVEMAEDAYELVRQARNENAGEIAGSVSSVSDNGQSVGYRGSEYAAVLKTVSEAFLKDYAERLAPFRKVGW